MRTSYPRSPTTLTGSILTALGLAGLLVGAFAEPGAAATAPVPLATTASFSVLAGSGITNTGPTTVFGDLGTFPTTSITGLSDITLGGVNHAGDAVTQRAKSNLVTAYNAAAGALPPHAITADLGGTTLVPGIYNATSSMGLTGALTLDAGGDPNAVFIFQAGSTLITASDSSVVLLNDAQACNIFWQVGSSATFGTGTSLRGNVLAHTSITANTDATFEGRLLASNGAVTLHSNVVTRPGCATTSPTASSSASPTGSPSGGGTTAPTKGAAPGAGEQGAIAGGGNGHGGPAATSTSNHRPSSTLSTAGAAVTPRATPTNRQPGPKHPNLPNTGGPSWWLLVLGTTGVLAGTALIVTNRRTPRHHGHAS